MAQITFQNLPSTSTPLNATNLNSMQVEDSGSNANGSYIKYNDGTMICWHQITGSTFSCTTSGGSGRYYYQDDNNSAENVKAWTYPVQFISVPAVNVNVSCNAYCMASLGGVTKINVGANCVLPYPVATTTFYWHFIAIGKWK